MRPIDADALKELLLKERDAIPKTVTAPYYEFSVQKPNHTGDLVRGGIKKALRCMENTPTITLDDLRPNGEWIERQYALQWCEDDVDIFYECSACQEEFLDESLYCPNCGAKMGGGE